MEQSGLGIYMFIRNGVYYDYPFVEALRSVKNIAEQIVVCECFSDKDDTFETLLGLQKEIPQLRVVRKEWVNNFRDLSKLGNYAATFLNTQWKWQLQGDEVVHEQDLPVILKSLQDNTNNSAVTALRVRYYHFLANYETEFDFCYRKLVRILKQHSKWELTGDACQLDGGDPTTVIDIPVHVYHYGKVHHGKVGWQKEWDFQQLYRDIGFPDPKMKEMESAFSEQYCDYVYLFEHAISTGKVRQFLGTHPAVMQNRIGLFKEGGWEQFQSRMKAGLSTLVKNNN